MPRGASEIAIMFDIGWLAEHIQEDPEKQWTNASDRFSPDCLRRARKDSTRVLEVLLKDHALKDLTVTEDILSEAAAAKKRNGKAALSLFLRYRQEKVSATRDIRRQAISNSTIDIETLELLFPRDANIQITEDVVKAAATSGQNRVLKFLKQYTPIDPSLKSISGLYNAAMMGNYTTVDKLLLSGVEPDFPDVRGVTPLWIAACNRHIRIIQRLLDTNRVNVNSLDNSNRSPLFRPAVRNNVKVLSLLLRSGATYTYVDQNGISPLEIAEKCWAWDVVDLLKSYNS